MYPTGKIVMAKQTAVRLPDETYERLQALAARTGRTATFYIRQAIEEHLEDLEDIYLAERVLEGIERGEIGTRPLKEVMEELGLDD
jgi:RHH-type transcriptional regulator, rel operon repressor / antitoxin RelB